MVFWDMFGGWAETTAEVVVIRHAEMIQSKRCQGRARSSFASVTSLPVTDEPYSAQEDHEA